VAKVLVAHPRHRAVSPRRLPRAALLLDGANLQRTLDKVVGVMSEKTYGRFWRRRKRIDVCGVIGDVYRCVFSFVCVRIGYDVIVRGHSLKMR
jgi:hypothetical protein